MNLNDRAMMVQLNISQWTARRYDRKASAEITDANNATRDAARVNKLLLPGADSLKVVHQYSTCVRQLVYDNTASCGIDGMQILANANYLSFSAQYRKDKAVWEQAVNEFCAEYPYLRAAAPRKLQGLYNSNDYPEEHEIRNLFRMELVFFPIPEGKNIRIPVSNDELTKIQQQVEDRVDTAAKAAMRDVWQRLFDKVQHIAAKCSDPSAIFRDTMIENAREICEVLPRLNFMDDPQLEALRLEVESQLLVHPDRLRTDPVLRSDTAAKAREIMDKMNSIMGGGA
jgi:hypothetical protein